ncbi:radical SAM/SPASM domain-containing protein [Acidobacteriota bacterium]
MIFKNFSYSVFRQARNIIKDYKMRRSGVDFYAKKASDFLRKSEVVPILPKTPLQITIENSSICNLDCVMCKPSKSTRKRALIEEELLKDVLIQFNHLGLNYTEFHTINEPLLHPKLNRLLELCRTYNVNVGLSTNGLLIKKEIDTLNNYSDILGISVSVDGATRQTYNRIREGGEFNDLMKNIDVLMNCDIVKKQGKLAKIQVVLSNMNISEAGQFFDTFKQIKPYYITFSLIGNLAAEDDFYKDSKFPFYERYKSKVPCALPFNYLWVLCDGKVTACCRDYHESLIVGNIENKPLLELWNSKEINALRKAHRSGNLCDYSVCEKCERLNSNIVGFLDAYLHYLFYKGFNSDQINEKILTCIKTLETGRKEQLEKLLL